ncbi:MAG: hypothetical protein KDK36_16555 [Leptospiraceae bacterium]|nr:hypothetical protein [Leptospiraceae bacterium]
MKLKILLLISIFASVSLFAEKKKLKLKKDELREENGKILFEPDRHIRRASYKTYIFDKKDFTDKIGEIDSLTKTINVQVESKLEKKENYDPEEGQKPIGGFNNKTYSVKIIKVMKK